MTLISIVKWGLHSLACGFDINVQGGPEKKWPQGYCGALCGISDHIMIYTCKIIKKYIFHVKSHNCRIPAFSMELQFLRLILYASVMLWAKMPNKAS